MKILDKNIQTDYKNRINRVFRYIDENLNSDLSLATVSNVAYFSPYHFHRIFKFITGETLNDYVTRKRIEKSASDLIHKNISISEIFYKYGFNDNSTFTRTFKKYYGISPKEFRKQNPNKFSKISQLESKNGQEYPDNDKYICIINNLKKWIKMNAKIEIKEMPKMDLAYVTCVGSQNVANAFQELIKWANPKGILNEKAKMIRIFHDSFKITDADKVRMSVGVTLNEPTEIDGEIGLATIKEGKCIVGSFEIGLNEFEKSWTGLFIWMNENGYKKSERNPFEIYHNNYKEHPEKKAIVDFCIPIE